MKGDFPPSLGRRRFLQGVAGALLPLPVLGSLHGCLDGEPHPLIVMRAASGVAQQDGEEPELWWPSEPGPLTVSSMVADEGRVTSELASFAEHLLMVRGTQLPFEGTGERHAAGGNQLLTAARPGPLTDTIMTYAQGESIDNWIARQGAPLGGEPLTLYAGRRDNHGQEVLSYRGPGRLRGAESEPWAVYRRLTGIAGSASFQTSLNDLVKEQLDALLGMPRLSAEDRLRLELHTDSIRDFELLSERLSTEQEQAMLDLDGRSTDDSVSLEVARLHCDLIAMVLASGGAHAVTLQIGDRIDRARYWVEGQQLPPFHDLSHRLVDPTQLGRFETIQQMHAGVNRLHLRVFGHLLTRLEERDLLDSSIAVFTSDVATGSHRYDSIPWIIAGAGDGSLRQGAFVDAAGQTHEKLLNSLLWATGHRQLDGSAIDFGDESLEGGLLEEMLA